MVAVDTNVLVRKITGDDSNLSAQASILLIKAQPNSLWLDRLILEELGYVLRAEYGFKKGAIAAVYAALLSEPVFYVPDRELVEKAAQLFKSEKPLSFEDCWLLALKQAGWVDAVATFDQNLTKRAQ